MPFGEGHKKGQGEQEKAIQKPIEVIQVAFIQVVGYPGGGRGDDLNEEGAEVVTEGEAREGYGGGQAPHGLGGVSIVEIQVPTCKENGSEPLQNVLRDEPKNAHRHHLLAQRRLAAISKPCIRPLVGDFQPLSFYNGSYKDRRYGNHKASSHPLN